MSDPSIYQAPLPQPPPHLPVTRFKPAVVNVLAILNLVFAGFGVLTTIWSLYIALVGNPFLKLTSGLPGMEAQIEAQTALQEKLKPMTFTSAALALLVAIPMIISGIQLLKNKANGLKWANGYAASSLTAKAINLTLAFLIMLPAMREMTDSLIGSAARSSGARQIMSISMIGGAVGGILATCLYPLLVLVLLNRGEAKEWFASLTGKTSVS